MLTGASFRCGGCVLLLYVSWCFSFGVEKGACFRKVDDRVKF